MRLSKFELERELPQTTDQSKVVTLVSRLWYRVSIFAEYWCVDWNGPCPKLGRNLRSLLFGSLFICFWRCNVFQRALLSILIICRALGWRLGYSSAQWREHVCNSCYIRQEQDIHYFIWWIIRHSLSTRIYQDLSLWRCGSEERAHDHARKRQKRKKENGHTHTHACSLIYNVVRNSQTEGYMRRLKGYRKGRKTRFGLFNRHEMVARQHRRSF